MSRKSEDQFYRVEWVITGELRISGLKTKEFIVFHDKLDWIARCFTQSCQKRGWQNLRMRKWGFKTPELWAIFQEKAQNDMERLNEIARYRPVLKNWVDEADPT